MNNISLLSGKLIDGFLEKPFSKLSLTIRSHFYAQITQITLRTQLTLSKHTGCSKPYDNFGANLNSLCNCFAINLFVGQMLNTCRIIL